MKKKISQSIRAKTFLGLLALLVVCCAAIYGMVMIFLPRNYYIDLKGQITADFDALVESLEETGWEDGQDRLHAFAAKNHALVNVINHGKTVFSVNYGDKGGARHRAPPQRRPGKHRVDGADRGVCQRDLL